MLDAVGFLLKYSLGLDLFLTLLIQDMVLFGDVMQTTSVPEINLDIPDPELCVPTIHVSNGKSFNHQNVSKSSVVSNRTPVTTVVTKVPTSNERRYPQRQRKPPQKLDL